MVPSPRRRVRADLLSFIVLVAAVGLLNASLQVPRQKAAIAEEEEEEGERATYGSEALRFQLMKLRDAYGRIPPNPYGRAKSQVDVLKWSAAAQRVEQSLAPPVSAAMFLASAPASAAAPGPRRAS